MKLVKTMCTQLCTQHSFKYCTLSILGDCAFCDTCCVGCHLFYSHLQWW